MLEISGTIYIDSARCYEKKDAVSVCRIHFTSKMYTRYTLLNDVFVILSAFCLPHMICAMMKIKATNKRNICQVSIQVCAVFFFARTASSEVYFIESQVFGNDSCVSGMEMMVKRSSNSLASSVLALI